MSDDEQKSDGQQDGEKMGQQTPKPVTDRVTDRVIKGSGMPGEDTVFLAHEDRD